MRGFAFGLILLGIVSSTAANAEGILAGADQNMAGLWQLNASFATTKILLIAVFQI